MHDDVVANLERARARTLHLTDLDEPTLMAQHDPLMSPLIWDLAHVGQQEELWPLWVPVGRMGVGADQARVLLFLASDLSAFVTGHTIPTDGGTAAAGGWFRREGQPGREWTNRPLQP